jgi:hypothetical protein
MATMPEYYQRWISRAWLETVLFTKRRLWFACSMAIVIALALWRFGTTDLTTSNLVRNLVIILGSYLAVWVLSFVINLGRVPALLDQNSASETAELTARLQRAEAIAQEKIDRKELETRFAALIQQGRQQVNSVGNCLDASALSAWSINSIDWRNRVCRELQAVWPTDVATFQYADAMQCQCRASSIWDTTTRRSGAR